MEIRHTEQNNTHNLLHCSSPFFAIMGEIFTSVMPESKYTLIQSMTVFGVTMGSFIGLPPSLVEIYSSDINKVYKANGVPLYLGLVLTNISAYIHLFIMSILLYITAPFFSMLRFQNIQEYTLQALPFLLLYHFVLPA